MMTVDGSGFLYNTTTTYTVGSEIPWVYWLVGSCYNRTWEYSQASFHPDDDCEGHRQTRIHLHYHSLLIYDIILYYIILCGIQSTELIVQPTVSPLSFLPTLHRCFASLFKWLCIYITLYTEMSEMKEELPTYIHQ